jgi:hypothetical protein
MRPLLHRYLKILFGRAHPAGRNGAHGNDVCRRRSNGLSELLAVLTAVKTTSAG